MATKVPIEIFFIGKTQADRDEMKRWLKFKGVKEFEFPPEDTVTDPALLIGMSAKRCFDDETEILTDEGWKLFDSLSHQERVLTFNPLTGASEWQHPYGYFADDYTGSMIVAEGRDLSLRVTPDHRIYGRFLRRIDSADAFVSAQSLLKSAPFCVPLALGTWVGEVPEEIRLPDYEVSQKLSNQFSAAYGTRTRTLTRVFIGRQVLALAKLLAYYVTEGTADSVGDDIRYLVVYGDHYQEVAAICSELGLKCSFTVDPRNGCQKIRIGGGRQLARYVAQQCGKLSYEKRLPRWVLDLPVADLSAIWDILVATDGTVSKGGQELTISTSKTLFDQAQEILVKMGSATSTSMITAKHRPGALIQSRRDCYITRRKLRRFAVLNNENSSAEVREEQYSGRIYCVATRNGVVCVRRAGKVSWSGNCYMAFDTTQNPNLQRVRKDWAEYLDNILKVGHGSVCEHANYSFAIENVSRVFTAEMNRHRAGWAISEGSMRFIRFSEAVPYWEPDSIKGPDVYSDLKLQRELDWLEKDQSPTASSQLTLEKKKHLTRYVFERAFDNQRSDYAVLERIWADELAPNSTFKQKKELTSLFRRIIGMGCATGGVWTGNIRAIRHVMTMRCEPAAEEEILHVFSRIVVMLKEREPMLVGDFQQDDQGFWRPKYRKV